jgi:hypothetical protein
VSVVCCQVEVEVFVSDTSLIHRGPTECGVFECDREAPYAEVLTPNRVEGPHKKYIYIHTIRRKYLNVSLLHRFCSEKQGALSSLFNLTGA